MAGLLEKTPTTEAAGRSPGRSVAQAGKRAKGPARAGKGAVTAPFPKTPRNFQKLRATHAMSDIKRLHTCVWHGWRPRRGRLLRCSATVGRGDVCGLLGALPGGVWSSEIGR